MLFPLGNPREKNRGMKDLGTELATQHSKPKSQFSLEMHVEVICSEQSSLSQYSVKTKIALET